MAGRRRPRSCYPDALHRAWGATLHALPRLGVDRDPSPATFVPGRFSVDTELFADCVRDVASRGSEREALGVRNAGIGFYPLGNDPTVPRTVVEDHQRLGTTSLQSQMVRHFPRGGKREPVASGETVRLVNIAVSVMARMQPRICAAEERVVLADKA